MKPYIPPFKLSDFGGAVLLGVRQNIQKRERSRELKRARDARYRERKRERIQASRLQSLSLDLT